MIAVKNPEPTLLEFKELMSRTDRFLNDDAKNRSVYYKQHTAQKLERDICDALNECAKGTKFSGTIELVSGSSFPDIVADRLYGVEVKSTEKNHWTSTGSSILESTRVETVERIYMTFGKLGGNPVEFKSRPYEEVLSEIAVTHYPRYKIDMNLKAGETIFDKMKIKYDELRKLKNPVEPVAEYYKSKLKEGQTLWWSADSEKEEESVPMVVRLYSTLDKEEKDSLSAQMLALFPEVLGSSGKKYEKAALWLITRKSVLGTSFRDAFSAGGKKELKMKDGTIVLMPAVFGRIEKYKDLIRETIENAKSSTLFENWGISVKKDRLYQWCELCAENYSGGNQKTYRLALEILVKIFSLYDFEEEALKIAEKDEF